MNELECWIGSGFVLIGLALLAAQIKSGDWSKPVPPASRSELKKKGLPLTTVIVGIHLVMSWYVRSP